MRKELREKEGFAQGLMGNTIAATEYYLSPPRLDLVQKETVVMGQHMAWENKADISQKPDVTDLWKV